MKLRRVKLVKVLLQSTKIEISSTQLRRRPQYFALLYINDKHLLTGHTYHEMVFQMPSLVTLSSVRKKKARQYPAPGNTSIQWHGKNIAVTTSFRLSKLDITDVIYVSNIYFLHQTLQLIISKHIYQCLLKRSMYLGTIHYLKAQYGKHVAVTSSFR